MTPFTLIMVSCVIQCIISCMASMLCPPQVCDKNRCTTCAFNNIASSMNTIISIVVILMLANVIPMPGSKGVIETTEWWLSYVISILFMIVKNIFIEEKYYEIVISVIFNITFMVKIKNIYII